MSAPESKSHNSPKRNGSARTPLRERTRSQANISSRIVRDARQQPVFNAMNPTPYPTKPEHVLRPSAVRKQRTRMGAENTFPAIFPPENLEAHSSSSLGGYLSDDSDRPRTANAPALSLKRSVAALRDMYEAQAEKSRPPTAVTSPIMRPTSAASNRLRSMSSSDSLSGGYIWESLQNPSIDDLAMLPAPLRTTSGTVRNVTSDLESRRRQKLQSSSPVVTKLGSSSTTRFPVYDDISSPQYGLVPSLSSTGTFTSSGPSSSLTSSSSPNVIRFGRSSSVSEISEEEESSSPNVIRMGTSSPIARKSSPGENTDLDSSPQTIRHHKRKRSAPQEMLSFAARSGIVNPFSSSPPYEASVESGSAISRDTGHVLPSSPPLISVDSVSHTGSETTSISTADRPETGTSDSSGIVQTHRDLQSAMTSSPAPPVQYPVVRAPAAASWTGLSVPKRPPRAAAADPARWTSRLSTVPSERSGQRSNRNSTRSDGTDDEYSLSDVESDIVPAGPYLANHNEAINSRSRMVSAASDHHEAEASDFVSALPSSDHRFSSPPTTGYLAVDTNSSSSRLNSLRTSMDTRLNSMRSFRNNSMRNSQRPSSSSSVNTFQVPSWARRYYSGIYRDSFHEMYASNTDLSSQNQSTSNVYGPAPRATLQLQPSISNITSSTRPSISLSRKASSIAASVRSIVFPRRRPHLDARDSHLQPGMGPLVSNPVRPPTASLRPVSLPLDPADPRAHWAGAEAADLAAHQNMIQNGLPQKNRMSHGRPTSWSRSPHLHKDDRMLHRHSRWKAPSLDERGEPFFSWRNAQVICFVTGFIAIVPWFVASALPLPARPPSSDLEKRMSTDVEGCTRRHIAVTDELRWENAAWWRNVNRCMCVVGIIMLILVIVLSVVGTRNW
jgi:hypothetical protein